MISDFGQRLNHRSADDSVSVGDHQAIDLTVAKLFIEVVMDPRQQIVDHIIPAGIEQETTADDLPGLRFFLFGGSPDRILLGDNVACTGEKLALPCEAHPADQFHRGCKLQENRARSKSLVRQFEQVVWNRSQTLKMQSAGGSKICNRGSYITLFQTVHAAKPARARLFNLRNRVYH